MVPCWIEQHPSRGQEAEDGIKEESERTEKHTFELTLEQQTKKSYLDAVGEKVIGGFEQGSTTMKTISLKQKSSVCAKDWKGRTGSTTPANRPL